MATGRTITAVQQQWNGNKRLQLGVFIIGAIFLLYIILLVREQQAPIKEECLQLADQLEKMNSTGRQLIWIDRSKEARAALVQAKLRIFQAETPGLAQAKIQNWFDHRTGGWGTKKKVQVTVDRAVPVRHPAGLFQVTATVSGIFDPERVARLLKDIETGERLMVVQTLDVVWKKNRGHFTLLCTAWFALSQQNDEGVQH